MVLRLLACLVGLLSGPIAAQAQDTTIAIGELSLGYDPAQWRIDRNGETFTASCLIAPCEHAIFEIGMESRPGGYCDKEEARREAEARFRFADRHPANTFHYERFALAMAESRKGSKLFVEEAVFACLTRDDLVYRFVSVARNGKFPAFTGGILLRLLENLSLPEPKTRQVQVAGLVLHYPSDRWQVAAEATTPERIVLSCLPPTCREHAPAVSIEVLTSGANCPPVADIYDGGEEIGPRQIVSAAGTEAIRFTLHEFRTGCRNWTPPVYAACSVHGGRLYSVRTVGLQGCLSSQETPEDAFIELLESATPR